VSQNNRDQGQAAETPAQETRTFIRQVRAATCRKYAPEDKIRIVLEGFRREVTVSDLCRREGIKPGVFYAWTKEFMEAGKERLTRDTVRAATRQEIEHLKRENHDGRTTTEEPRRKNHDGSSLLPTFPWRSTASKKRPSQLSTGPQAHERPGEVERHNPGGRDPVGKTEVTHPTAGAQE